MSAYIHYISTETPPFACSNDVIRDRMKAWTSDTRVRSLIDRVYERSGIKTRHSALPDFSTDNGQLFRTLPDGGVNSPLTGERNQVYGTAANELSVKLVRKILSEYPTYKKEEITHLIYTSCTGFTNPGPDYHIIRELGLNHDIERYTIGFMGCYAAFPALRMAKQFCEANPKAVVLVVTLELCTLHFQPGNQPEGIVANALFADGAAAAIVSARRPAVGRPYYRLSDFHSTLIPSGEAEMAWDIGDHGFNMTLSAYVPDIIGSNISGLLEPILAKYNLTKETLGAWAVHPGGRAILDQIQRQLLLSDTALDVSRGILCEYGNMSSATILFVLKRQLEENPSGLGHTCAMAFGPGLTVEIALLEHVGKSSAPTD
jgi:predicted naringenin-chalcone synthase